MKEIEVKVKGSKVVGIRKVLQEAEEMVDFPQHEK